MNKFKGFTVIEVMIVLAILGILACIALGAMNTPRNKYVHQSVENVSTTSIRAAGTRYDIFTLPDGTQCVASYTRETLTCNWKNESSSSSTSSGY